MRKGVYVVVTHRYTPADSKDHQWQANEECYFVDRVKNNMLNSATIILDMKNETVVKCRMPDLDFEKCVNYLKSSYAEKFHELEKYLHPDETKDESEAENDDEIISDT